MRKGIAQACGKFGALQMISNNASMTPEQIVKDKPDQHFAWQLYVQVDRKKSEGMLARINKLPNIKFIVLTLDAPVPGKREVSYGQASIRGSWDLQAEKSTMQDDERCQNVASNLPVSSAVQEGSASKPSMGGIGKELFAGTSPNLTWQNTLPWLARQTKLPIVLKGIQIGTYFRAIFGQLIPPAPFKY